MYRQQSETEKRKKKKTKKKEIKNEQEESDWTTQEELPEDRKDYRVLPSPSHDDLLLLARKEGKYEEKEEIVRVEKVEMDGEEMVMPSPPKPNSEEKYQRQMFEEAIGTDPHEDQPYFDSYATLHLQHDMLSDKNRTEKFREAIFANKDKIEGKIVLDCGAGTGMSVTSFHFLFFQIVVK